MQRPSILSCSIVWLALIQVHAQGPVAEDERTVDRQRLTYTVAGGGLVMAGSLVALDRVWYSQYPRSGLHSFDDSREWLQMDKAGHLWSAYSAGEWGKGLLTQAGVNDRTARWAGGTVGLAFLTAVELLDGTSAEWGFSWWDMAANVAGTGLFVGQDALWGEQRIRAKYSVHFTRFAAQRPELLGSSKAERILKDYNGHTFWLSVNIYSFLKEESKFPKWLNVAIGHGATGLLGGHDNVDSDGNVIVPRFVRQRQFLLSLDVDLTKIPTKKKWLRSIFKAVSLIKMPFPAMRIGTEDGVKFEPFYF